MPLEGGSLTIETGTAASGSKDAAVSPMLLRER
jgi:hypothetical protein